MMNPSCSRRIILFLLFTGLFSLTPGWCAFLWKDDFTDELIYELTWDTKHTTGTPTIENNRCVLNTNETSPVQTESIITLPARALPPNFDLFTAMEFTNIEAQKGEVFIQVGKCMELVISFGETTKNSHGKDPKSPKQIYIRNPQTKEIFSQTSDTPNRFNHNISSGERYFISWLSNGETPSIQVIKVGTGPGEANVAEFIIEAKKQVSGLVEIGIRNGIKEIRLNSVRAYLYGTSSTLVHDWVLF